MPPSGKALRRQLECLLSIVEQLCEAVQNRRPADAALAAILRGHREFGSRDRRFFAEASFAYFRWKGWADACANEPSMRLALSWRLDGNEPHPALPDADALIAGAMRRPAAALVPEWLPRHVAAEHFERFVESIQKRPPVWLRAQRGFEDALAQALSRAERPPVLAPTAPGAVGFRGSANLDLIRREIGQVFEVQDLASQRVGLVCDPKPGESWWDVCAGAGGKSLHLADLMQNRGDILATDVRDKALAELHDRARKAKASIIRTAPITAYRSPVTLFDGILVDAPCTGNGTWSRNPDARWRTEESSIDAQSDTQLEILNKVAPHVKPSGTMVYAVCTVTHAETMGVCNKFLAEREDFTLESSLQIWPWSGPCDGMFIARMRRSA